MLHYQNFTYTIYGKIIKKSFKNNRSQISGLTWREKFELFDGTYSASDIIDHFEYFMKKNETATYNPPIRIYVNK